MRIAAAQLNQVVGDFRGNADRIITAARDAVARGARVLLTPEMSLAGYPPEDLLLRATFHRGCEQALAEVCEATAGLDLYLLLGHPRRRDALRCNGASLVYRGHVLGEYDKHELPNYDVFDEYRYYQAGDRPLVFEVDGVRFGVAICEDFWFPEVPARARAAGAQVLLALNASPFHMNKQHERLDVARANVCSQGLSMLAANLVGGQDELVFDGLSFALDASGELMAQAPPFREDLLVVELSGGTSPRFEAGAIQRTPPLEEQVYGALVLGVRDYLAKNDFPGALIGMSGGIDSALTLAIAVDAIGPHKVRAVMMPSRYTAGISGIDARDMVARVGVRCDELPIEHCFQSFLDTLAVQFHGLEPDTAEENIQARVRGTLMMALSNKSGSIVLTTGNKSEMAVGYCTLYGDMAGGFAVLKDIAKTMVYRLARWRNAQGEVIPERIITRAPSAELKANQTDQDSLPPYEVLDAIMQMYMENNCSIAEIEAAGHPRAAIDRVVRLIRISEYKRRQAPVGIRVTHRAFGRDWRNPITSRFRD
ncbi:MAG: NAD+ synthase [Burkholderiaceae bacterium]|nr:NAD+ synthase [Burkholderiaceae bacterium]